MAQSIRAVYEQGHLRLLDPVQLQEGQEVQLTILSERDLVRAALGDLLVKQTLSLDDEMDEEAIQREIAK